MHGGGASRSGLSLQVPQGMKVTHHQAWRQRAQVTRGSRRVCVRACVHEAETVESSADLPWCGRHPFSEDTEELSQLLLHAGRAPRHAWPSVMSPHTRTAPRAFSHSPGCARAALWLLWLPGLWQEVAGVGPAMLQAVCLAGDTAARTSVPRRACSSPRTRFHTALPASESSCLGTDPSQHFGDTLQEGGVTKSRITQDPGLWLC